MRMTRAAAMNQMQAANQQARSRPSERPDQASRESRASRDSVQISAEGRQAARARGGVNAPGPEQPTSGPNQAPDIGTSIQFSERTGLSFGGKG